jgi:ribose transport system substrate-binding protein
MKKLLLLALIPFVFVIGCKKEENRTSVAFVTNGIASFWVIAEKGANDAADKLGVDVQVRMPGGAQDQKRMVEDLLAKNIDGIAISPIKPSDQGDLLDEISAHTNLITQDSDAPDSKRLVYIGVDNYVAGRMCGELVKEAIPDGGEVMIYVGRLGQDNARLRRQGVIDELLDREHNNKNYDEVGKVIKGEKYTILGTRTDEFVFEVCKAKAQDDIAKHRNIKCMVGLFAYNPPQILEAVKEANKTAEIKIVGFDEEGPTLQGIIDGTIYGTTVQNPYQYGYKSVEILTALARGDKSVIPESGFINVPARNIRKDNVDAFWTELKRLTGKGGDEKADDKKADEKTG